MNIVLSGVETTNKGAELMLYAILQEIERRFPHATVFLSKDRICQGTEYIQTKLDFRELPYAKLENTLHLNALIWRFHLPYRLMPHMMAINKIDYFIDGSGFKYSDQFNFTRSAVTSLGMQLLAYRKKKAKIVFLPQAFGPFEKKETKNAISVLNTYASVLMPRETVSYRYIEQSGVVDMDKVRIFPDFTSLVKGEFPERYSHLKNSVCIIPNQQMFSKGVTSKNKYLELLSRIIEHVKKAGHNIFLLNHEGIRDEKLCMELKAKLSHPIEVITGLNALEVKGLIASSYLVISSRFHGVASALNSCVPSLATSWSHKYEELFKDYNLDGCILSLDDTERTLKTVDDFLQEAKNKEIRDALSLQIPRIEEATREMWNVVWNQ